MCFNLTHCIVLTGATWATVDAKSSETVNDEFFGEFDVDVNLKADLKLREMNSEVAVSLTFDGIDSGEGEMFGGTETYENIADKSGGDMKSTFEDMDTAGAVAQWMLWLGIITMLLTAILCFCSLAQITNSRFTTYSGAIGTFFVVLRANNVVYPASIGRHLYRHGLSG